MPQLDLEVFFEQIAGFYLIFIILIGHQVDRSIYNNTLSIKLRKFLIETNNKQVLYFINERVMIINSVEKILLK